MLQVEHVRREWEAKLAEGKSQFDAKLAEHDVGVAEVSRLREQYESTLAEKEQVSLSRPPSLSIREHACREGASMTHVHLLLAG